MSNDVASSAPSAAPPSSAPAPSSPDSSPSTPHEPSPPELLAHLAKGEDISEYAEQVKEDRGEINRDASPTERAFNRHQRARAKIERLRAENAALREQRAEPRSADGAPENVERMLHPEETAAPDAAQDAEIAESPTNGEQQEQQEPETHEQVVERLTQEVAQDRERERHAGSFHARKEIFELMFPDNAQVLGQAPQVEIPRHIENQILAAKHGPFIQRLLAMPENQGDLFDLLQAPPEQAMYALRRLDHQIEAGAQQRIAQSRQRPQQHQQHRDVNRTQARPPIRPLRGSGGPSPDLRGLASGGDDISGYARQRLAQMRAKDR